MEVLQQRLRIAALAVALTCTAAALVEGTAAVASTTRSSTYVAAGGTYVAGPDLAAKVVGDQTGVRTAPLGTVTFVAPTTASPSA